MNRLVGVVTGGHVVNHWYLSMLAVVLPTVRAALGLSEVQVGTITSASQLAIGLLNLPAGMLADALGRHRALFLGGSAFAGGLGYSLLGIAPSYGVALLCGALLGLSACTWHIVALSWLGTAFPDRRATVLAVHGTGATVSDTLSPLVVGALLGAFAWQSVLGWQLALGLVAALVIWWMMRPAFNAGPASTPMPIRQRLGGLRSILDNRTFVAIVLASSFNSAGRSVILTFLPIYLQEQLGYTSVVLGLHIALLNAAGILS
ncbi:MAG: MFS transporter, partial [Chloroflexi bacterium]|nr:MFS transporter [Chloroflexota bacterium]